MVFIIATSSLTLDFPLARAWRSNRSVVAHGGASTICRRLTFHTLRMMSTTVWLVTEMPLCVPLNDDRDSPDWLALIDTASNAGACPNTAALDSITMPMAVA